MEIIKCGECGGELFADPALKAELETAQHLEIENGITYLPLYMTPLL